MEKTLSIADAELLLVEHGVRPTSNRIAMCRALAEAQSPLSQIDLESLLMTNQPNLI